MFFESMVKYLRYNWVYIVFCFMVIFNNMNMNWFMIIRKEFEYKPKNNKNRWHTNVH